MSLTDTHIVTPNLVNEARMGFSRLPGLVVPESQIPLSLIGMRLRAAAAVSGVASA